MKRIIRLIFLLGGLSAFSLPAQSPLQTLSGEPLPVGVANAKLAQLMVDGRVPGLSLAYVQAGKLHWQTALGLRNQETATPVKDSTVFQAASLSKVVVAYLFLKLWDEGLIEPDRPLHTYLSPAQWLAVCQTDSIRDPQFLKLTARMCLSHTTGFPNWRGNGPLHIEAEPGSRFSYSGEGFGLLQRVVEQLTETSLEELAQTHVFEPLKMRQSSFVSQASAAGYAANGHGEFGEVHELRNIPADGAHAAYSLQTTAGDYARFWAALLQGKGLKPSSWQAMLTPHRPLPMKWGQYDSLSTQLSWGLGVGLQQSKEGQAIWHWGNNGDFRCYVLGYPDRKQGLVYFTNSANGLRISQALLGQLLGGDQPALAWIGEENYQSPGVNFRWEVFRFGAEVAFQRLKEAAPEVIFGERMMNGFGYQLMQLKRWDDARAIFAYNLAQYPKSANAYDSYAELLLRRGELAAAANNYRRSLELNPRNPAAVQLMQSLAKSQAETGRHTFVLPGFPDAKFITLAGDFNEWNELHTCFIRKGEQWVCSVDWEAGEYLYKFVVDGKWILDPTHSDTRTDAAEHINSVIQVEK